MPSAVPSALAASCSSGFASGGARRSAGPRNSRPAITARSKTIDAACDAGSSSHSPSNGNASSNGT